MVSVCFAMIAYNNISVSFLGMCLNLFFSVGSLGFSVMAWWWGSFQYYFISNDLGFKFITVVFIHGTMELWSIVVAGASGMILGSSIFPGTYTRAASAARGGRMDWKSFSAWCQCLLLRHFSKASVTSLHWDAAGCEPFNIGRLGIFIIWYFFIYLQGCTNVSMQGPYQFR